MMMTLVWSSLFAIIGFMVGVALAAAAVVCLPADYFDPAPAAVARAAAAHPLHRWTLFLVRNVVGAALVVVGIALLFLPGQGLLTLLFGLMLVDFPGKRALVGKLLARPHVMSAANRWRAKFGKPPLRVPKSPER